MVDIITMINTKKIYFFFLKTFIILIFIIACLELIVRFLGIADIPIRLANKELGYIPVGLGKEIFSDGWLRDNQGENISNKNEYYGENIDDDPAGHQ